MTNLFMKVNKDLFKLGLNPVEILLISQVMEFQVNKTECYMTDAQFAENFGVSSKTISRALERLENELHFITRTTKTVASRRMRTITFNQVEIEKKLSNGQNDCLEEVKQTICPSETDKMSISDRQNDLIKDNIKDNLVSDAEEGTLQKPIKVSREWLIERHNSITKLANGVFRYNNKFYIME